MMYKALPPEGFVFFPETIQAGSLFYPYFLAKHFMLYYNIRKFHNKWIKGGCV